MREPNRGDISSSERYVSAPQVKENIMSNPDPNYTEPGGEPNANPDVDPDITDDPDGTPRENPSVDAPLGGQFPA